MYRESSATNASIAIFIVTNQTAWHTFLYSRGELQLKTPRGWHEDEHTWIGGSELTGPIPPRHSEVIKFPVPDGGAAWRCSVLVSDITYSPFGRPNWQRWILDRIRRAGANLEPHYMIWSAEIAK